MPKPDSNNPAQAFAQCMKATIAPYDKEISDLKKSLVGQQAFNRDHPTLAAFTKIFYDREAHLKDDLNQANFNHAVILPIAGAQCIGKASDAAFAR